MRTLVLATLSLAIPPALAAQTGQFVVRLGNDTLAIEQYTRTRDRLQGEQAVRSPRTVHRLYSATFGSGGAIARFELVTHNVSGAPGPAETRAGAEFTGDSAVVTVPRRDSTVTLRVKAGPGAVPFIGQGFGLIEEVTRRARASGGARYTTTMLPLGDTEPMQVTVTARGADSLTIVLGTIGPLRARVDAQGTLLGLTGIGSTMQVTVERTQGLDFAALGKAFAPRSLGVLSPPDSVKTSVAGAALTVRYSRPSTRGRAIFGNVVPWDQVWRTGANQATIFETSTDLVIAGTAVPAGKYSLWILPTEDVWTLIVSNDWDTFHTNYRSRYDLGRVKMQKEKLSATVEQLTFTIEPNAAAPGGRIAMAWATTKVSVPFTVE